MTHITPKQREELSELEPMLQMVEGSMGFLPTSMMTMAHWPELTHVFGGLGATILNSGELDAGLKQMIAFAVSNAAGCRYCQAHTANSAQKNNVSVEKIKAVFEFESSALFSDQEKAALRVAVHAGMVPNAVEAVHMSELSKHFSDKQVIEVVAVISLFGFLNRWNDTMATTLENSPKSFAADQLASHGWVAGKHE
ncbi:carboxymuconolactone decarboxylase family protein [Gammaproteobacteria bacterium]|nr:carboxymuconolactone decarboxylase family protein [Gammaproteobacteria bacterium]